MKTATIIKRETTDEIVKLGGAGLFKCYQCGSCTATCPMSEKYSNISFRKTIKYVQLGLQDKVLTDLTPWLCYYCGECSKSCPRQADPGEVMMAVRRYAISKYSVGRIAGLFYNKVIAALSWTILSLIALIGLLMFMNPNVSADEMRQSFPFCFIEKGFIHDAGLILGAIVIALALANLYIVLTI